MAHTVFNPSTTAAALRKFAEAKQCASLRQQIATPEVWAAIEEMKAQGYTAKTIAKGLAAVGLIGAETTMLNYMSNIAREKREA